jgi:hypothetical protein
MSQKTTLNSSLSALFFWNQLTALSEGCLYIFNLSTGLVHFHDHKSPVLSHYKVRYNTIPLHSLHLKLTVIRMLHLLSVQPITLTLIQELFPSQIILSWATATLEPELTQRSKPTLSGQTPDKEVKINRLFLHDSGYKGNDPTSVPSPNNSWLSGPTRWVCFETTPWPDTSCG